ncbi:MAG TPA: ATP synthase F0 subunit B, partial [Thermodesulfobacteriaceae bacterium]|nr:ATP synthase F0 subunit B [Thermodesulfobacteriaceae bacterium]
EYERKLSNLDAEADRILKVFTEQGIAEKEKIISQAHEAAERIKAQAELYVEQELAKARAELRAEAADLAVKMAEELIVKNVTDQDHQKLISENLERVVSKN